MQHGQTFTRRIVTTLLLSLALGVRAASAGSISIHWDANAEPDVAGYRLFIGTLPGVYSSSVDVGNKTSYVFNAAAAGQRYCFAVAAYSAGPRLGDKSVEVCSDTSGNQPPTLASPGNQTNAVGAPLTLTLDGSDPDNTPVTYSATGLPPGLTLNTNTGFISGTPTTVGTYSPHATVSDGSLSMTQAFTWKISASLPGAAAPLRPSGSVGTTTPTFEWESVATATSYRLWVDDASTTDPKIQIDVTPTQAGCTTTGAVCHVSPGVALAVGRASWSVRASNASGAGPWSGALDFTVADSKAPAISIIQPTSAAITTSNGTIDVGGKASDDAAVTLVTWTNNLGGSGTAAGTNIWMVTALPLKVGANVLTFTARDAGGNIGTTVLTVTKADAQGPALSIQSPTTTATYSTANRMLALSGSASDDGTITQVSWANDRGGSGAAVGTTAWSIGSVALKPGVNVITVTARDNAGNTTTKALTATLTDSEAPTVTIGSPTVAAGYSTNANSLLLGGTASDDVALAEVAWSNSQGGAGVAVGTSAWSVPAVTLKPGLNTLTVTARDTAGNTASATLAVRVTDVKAPTVTVTGPSSAAAFSSAAGTINLEGVSTDDFGVTRLTWVSDRGASGVATVKADGRWIVGGITLQAGVNVLTVTAADAAGNTAMDVARITYDRGLPTISLTSPTATATFTTSSSNVALAGTAADDGGIARVTWATDKGQMGDAIGTTAWTIPAVTVPLGTTVVTVTAHDNSGNATALTLSIVNADTAKPTVKIYTPTTASTMTTSGSTVTLAGTAADNVGVTQVTWATDGGANGTAYGTASWSTGGIVLTAGTTSTITVTARDAAGNSGVAVFTVTALKAASVTNPTPVPSPPTAPASSSSDKTSSSPVAAPVVRIVTPTPAHRFSTTNASVSLSGVASHASGISVVRWTTDRGDSGVAAGTSKWTVAAIQARPGRTIVTVTAATTSGEMTSDVLTVVRPNPLPKLSLRYPMADSQWTSGTATVTLKGTATDNVTRVLWSSDSGATGVADGTTGWTIANIGLQAGVNRITLTAQDADGRTDRQVLKITYRARTVLTSGAVQTASRATVGLE